MLVNLQLKHMFIRVLKFILWTLENILNRWIFIHISLINLILITFFVLASVFISLIFYLEINGEFVNSILDFIIDF